MKYKTTGCDTWYEEKQDTFWRQVFMEVWATFRKVAGAAALEAALWFGDM